MRRSSSGLVALLCAACGEATDAPRPDAASAPHSVPDTALVFEDVTAASGVDFVHVTGGFGEKRLPETMGAGATLFDHDGDGALDLFLVNGTGWPDAPAESRVEGRCALYRGHGDGTFTDVSAATGADREVFGMGSAAADHDGDGDADVYVTTIADDLLLVNDGGRFEDGATRAGVGRGRWTDADGASFPEWTTACLWVDVDVDGWLDLFVGGYCEWTPEIEIFTTLDGSTKAFTTPDRYRGLPSRLYRNQGDGTFEELAFERVGDVPAKPGERSIGKSLGAATWDLDEDGLPEILVANDTRPNFVFWNLGGGAFREVGTETGLAYDENGRARAGMGIDVGLLAGESAPVVVIGNFAEEELTWRRLDGDLFRSEAGRVGVAAPTVAPLSFGLALQDLDLDGHLDLIVANGHIEPDIARSAPTQTHAQAAQLFLGSAGHGLVDVSRLVGPDFVRPRVGRGLVTGDLDGDGDLDVVLTQNGGRAVVLRNGLQERASSHWLRVELAGNRTNRAALGARVELTSGGVTQVRELRTGSSYLGHGDTAVTFGLGERGAVERLEVRWPDGTREVFPVPAVDRTVRLSRNGGAPR